MESGRLTKDNTLYNKCITYTWQFPSIKRTLKNQERERGISRAGVQMGYLLSDAIELGQDVKEWHLGDDELLLLILVEGGSRKVQCQVHKGGLHHRLLVLIIMEQLLFFFCWLKMSEKKKGERTVSSRRPP